MRERGIGRKINGGERARDEGKEGESEYERASGREGRRVRGEIGQVK